MTAVIEKNGHVATVDRKKLGEPIKVLNRDVPRSQIVGVFDQVAAPIFTHYQVALQFEHYLVGGIPQKPEIIESWLRQRMIGGDEELRLQTLRVLEEMTDGEMPEIPADASIEQITAIAATMAKQHNGNSFYRDADGYCCVADYQIKACLKEAAAVMFSWQEGHKWGPTKKAARSATAEWVYVDQHRPRIGPKDPDGTFAQVGHISDAKGKRSTLTYYDYYDRPRLEFSIRVLRDRIEWDQWAELWSYAESGGLGALRSLSHGQFKVVEFEKVG